LEVPVTLDPVVSATSGKADTLVAETTGSSV